MTLLLDLPSHLLSQLVSHCEAPHAMLCTCKAMLANRDDPMLAAEWLARWVVVCGTVANVCRQTTRR